MATDTATTGREMPLEGTDLLRMIQWACDRPYDLEYLGDRVVPTPGEFSEIELWALAGILLDSSEDFARFIAHYTGCVLHQTRYRGEATVGYEKPAPDHPNPDPVPIWKQWVEARIIADDRLRDCPFCGSQIGYSDRVCGGCGKTDLPTPEEVEQQALNEAAGIGPD
jgi:hypothetical protein